MLTFTVLTVTAPGVLDNDTGSPPVAINPANATDGTLTLHADGSFTSTPTIPNTIRIVSAKETWTLF